MNLARISASFIVANEHALSFFAEQHFSAIGTQLIGGNIPRGKIAVRVAFAAVEYRAVATVLGNHLCLALGALDAKLTYSRLCKFTFGIATTSIE